MAFSNDEIVHLEKEDFTMYSMLTIGIRPHVINTLTIVHKKISFDAAEKGMFIHSAGNGIEIRIVPYDFLKAMKRRFARPKDRWDIARLDEFRNKATGENENG